MPWSIFTQGGGPPVAKTWAIDLLKKIGAPLTKGNEQFIFDWEVSEGGGGKYNPLNQGPVPDDPSLTSTGPQYGGGAADFVSWQAGLTGAADYLEMPAYVGIADSLRANDPVQARADLIASPWASSHYGGGSAFSNQGLPGTTSVLPTGTDSSGGGSTTSSNPVSQLASGIGSISTDFSTFAVVGPLVVAGGALIVWGFARMTSSSSKATAARAKLIGAVTP